MVGSPTYKGNTAIEAKQTYINEDGGYHSETVQSGAQRVGEDRYYGQAIYIKPDWQFHDLGVVFQQWSPDDPSGPWLVMLIENDYIRSRAAAFMRSPEASRPCVERGSGSLYV
jgi:hypothetical protein